MYVSTSFYIHIYIYTCIYMYMLIFKIAKTYRRPSIDQVHPQDMYFTKGLCMGTTMPLAQDPMFILHMALLPT